MSSPQDNPPPASPNKPRRRRSGSIAAEWEARVIPFLVTLGLIFFLLWFLGPIDLFGGRREAGKFFIALAAPIVGVAWLYDPVSKRLNPKRQPQAPPSLAGRAPESRLDRQVSQERSRMLAGSRAEKSRAKRPFANHKATPFIYGLSAILLLNGLGALIISLGLTRAYDGGALTYVLAVGGFLAAAFMYEPITSALDRRFGDEPS